MSTQAAVLYHDFENDTFKINAKYPRGHNELNWSLGDVAAIFNRAIVRLISRIHIVKISSEIDLRWQDLTDDWLVNIGPDNGLVPSGNKP